MCWIIKICFVCQAIVRLHEDQSSAWCEHTFDLTHCLREFLIAQMLKQIASEYHIDRTISHRLHICHRTLNSLHSWFRILFEIRRIVESDFFSHFHVVYKVTIPCPDVEHSIRRRNIFFQKTHNLPPDDRAIIVPCISRCVVWISHFFELIVYKK